MFSYIEFYEIGSEEVKARINKTGMNDDEQEAYLSTLDLPNGQYGVTSCLYEEEQEEIGIIKQEKIV
jgi:hypothetical protein